MRISGSVDLLSVTMHAEHLERDDVWMRVSSTARDLGRRRIPITFFVHPFHAIRAGFDLRPRLEQLLVGGHEIGQHTHYYGRYEETPAGVRKETSLDPDTVERCLDRDHAYLRTAGITPAGYVSGGWAIPDGLFGWLRERAFAYDCSFRSYRLPYANPASLPGDDATVPFRVDGLLEIPTTARMSAWLRARATGSARSLTAGRVRYELVYLHDTDLLHGPKRAMLRRLVPLLVRRRRPVAVGELASIVADELGGGHDG